MTGSRRSIAIRGTAISGAKGGTVIGGLGHGRTYGVITTSDTVLQLGTTFQSAAVDTVRDVLTFAAPHNLHDGDRVIYRTDGGSPVGGLANGGIYEVVVIEP